MTLPDSSSHDDASDLLKAQAEALCQTQDHITRVIGGLDIPKDAFTDQYSSGNRATFDFEPVIRMFLYQKALAYNQSELRRRLEGAAYVYMRFDLERPPTQQSINYLWRNRLSRSDRQLLTKAAEKIRTVCEEHGVTPMRWDAPDATHDAESGGFGEEDARNAIQTASELVFSKFDTRRASNAKYDDEVFFERHGFSAMSGVGMTGDGRRHGWYSRRDEVPHGRTQERTLKKTATPAPRATFDDFSAGGRTPDWKRIRDRVLEPFHDGIGDVLEKAIERKDGPGVREPVVAAIDVTSWEFYGSPTKDPLEVGPEDYTVRKDEDMKYIDASFPSEVSGTKGQHKRVYEFATITIIAGDRPFILGIEPVRNESWWEKDDPNTPSKADTVDRLLEQAEQHVDIQKVFLDREFDAHEVRNRIDQRDITYLLPKRKYEKDLEDIEKVQKHPTATVGVKRKVALTSNDRTHDVNFMYVPSDRESKNLAVFTTNRDVGPETAERFCAQYRHRWEIENQYKTIKRHFLPPCGSTDYRLRFLYFVLGVILYNVWKLANYLLLEALDTDPSDGPILRAVEVLDIIISFYIDPGG